MVSLGQKDFEYLLGLLLTDGWKIKKGNYERYSIELKEEDCNILEKYHNKIQNSAMTYRTRNTNFAKNYCCGKLEIRDKELILNLNKYWIDEDKTLNVKIPDEFLLSPAIWRGILDGDGCYGFRTKTNTPFVGLVTKSENLKNDFLYIVKQITGFDMKASRNKRDNVYNLGLVSVKAKKFITWLLSEDDNYIERKHDIMIKISQWEPKEGQGKSLKRWTPEEEEYILSHSIEESLLALNRTKRAIMCRKAKINKEKRE